MKTHSARVGGRSSQRLIQRISLPILLSILLSTALATTPAFAEEEDKLLMEEIVVTAQRVEQRVQDVPIAVTALTEGMLEDRQIINPSDLQMNVPNVSFTATNFGGQSFSIRGIGRLLTAGSGDAGVSTHLNEIAVATNLTAIEFYDMERVEVMRGPQGTLFGRNATGGAVNFVTRQPKFDTRGGHVDLEYGDYDHQRIKGAFNFAILDNLAFRVAGMKLRRDGYIRNSAHGQVGLDGTRLSGIDDDIDGRDVYSYRITGRWQPTERSNIWFMKAKFHEDDDKVRITNQVCVTNDLPTTGCEPNAFGFESPHAGTGTGGIFGGLLGALPLGDRGESDPNTLNTYNFPRTSVGFREMHTDFEPEFVNREDLWGGGASYDFDRFSVSLIGAYQDSEYLTRQDYYMDVGPTFGPTAQNPAGLWPTSETPGRSPNAGFRSGDPCKWADGTLGIFGGCVHPSDQTRFFAFDQGDSDAEYWTIEAKIASDLDGRFNFVVGGSYYHSESVGDYYVNSNSLDMVGLFGVPALAFPPLYPTMFDVPGDPSGGYEADGWATFGEVYFQATDDIKLTVGLRYNEDNKDTSSFSALFNSANVNALLGGALGPDPFWSRVTGFIFGAPLSPDDQALVDLYGATAAFAAASITAPVSPERLGASGLIPIVPGFNETRALTGSPDSFEFDDTTGRIGVDWRFRANSMAYAFYSRGYKPGGFNPPINPSFQASSSFDFDSEEVNAFEIGSKNIVMNGQLVLNGSLFYYDYSGLQVARLVNNSSLNANIDAKITGLELETVMRPDAVPNLNVDFAYAWLHTEVDGSTSVDPIGRTAGNPAWILLQNIDPGSLTGVNYIALTAEVLPLVPAALAANGALDETTTPATVAGTVYANGIPAYFSRNFLEANGAMTSDGLDTDLDGNELPASPEHSFKLGADYTWDIDRIWGALTLRADYYWQGESYAREFNTKGDEIDSWDQLNLSLIYRSNDGRWQARAWIRNVMDEDNVTGKYLTTDTSGFYRNYFLTEPRIYGMSLRYSYERNR
ncbi:MAG: TonB-dependent receptor [Gammaproteobacteria bacterium]|nr:TonB-dependent receptor [Gammaproteobacteria bacterium]